MRITQLCGERFRCLFMKKYGKRTSTWAQARVCRYTTNKPDWLILLHGIYLGRYHFTLHEFFIRSIRLYFCGHENALFICFKEKWPLRFVPLSHGIRNLLPPSIFLLRQSLQLDLERIFDTDAVWIFLILWFCAICAFTISILWCLQT